MKDYIIKVNGLYFIGVDIENCHKTLPNNCSWVNYNRNQADILLFDKDRDKAKVIECYINLKSYLDKILTAEKLEFIDIETLEIICVGNDKKGIENE